MRRRAARAAFLSVAAAFVLTVGFAPAAAKSGAARPESFSPAASAGFTFAPVADAYVSSAKPTANYGSATRLKAEGSPVLRTYLRFSGGRLTGQVTRATLWLYAITGSGVGYTIHSVSDSSWQESSITYANAPLVSVSPIGSATGYGSGVWTAVDVTAIVSATGSVNLALSTSSANALSLGSRESRSKSSVLVIETNVSDFTPPSAPTSLSVTASTGSSVSLSWTAANDNVGVAGYGVYRNGSLVGSTPQTTYTLSGLACGTSYSVGVDAHDAAGNGSPQTTLMVTTATCPDTTAPSAPSASLIDVSASATGISLSWSASTDNVAVAGYNLFLNGTKIASTAATNYSFGGLSCGTSYTLGVQAYDAAGNRSETSIVAATSPCLDSSAPIAPTGLLATAASSTSISILWDPSFDNVGVSGYDVFANGSKIGSTPLTNYTVGGLSCGTSYTLGVDAYDGAGNASARTTVTAATSACQGNTGPSIKYRFAYSNRTDQNLMPQYGFNLIDVSTKSEADATPAGTQGQLWLYDYDNTTCAWEKDDTYIRNMVSSVANDPKVAGFYFSNEPDPFACPNAPQQHKDRNALIKSLAPTKYTLIGIDANWRQHFDSYGTMWKGTADYINYNPYICYVGQPCDFAWEDHVLQVAQSLGQPYFVTLQAFKEGTEWRWPTAAEESQMLDRLKDPNLSGLSGYMTFSWNWNNDPLLNHPEVLNVIKDFNLGTSTSPGDTTAPSAPTGLSKTASTATSVSLTWNASTDNVGVAGYGVYLNGLLVSTTSGTSSTVGGLTCDPSYTFSVDAYDAAGNRSAQASLSAAAGSCTDTAPPTAPSNLNATGATTSSVSFSWAASSDNVGITGYDVYRNGTKIGSVAETNYTFGGLTCETSYTLGVEAYDAAGNHSARASVGASTTACSAATSDPVIAVAGDSCGSPTSCGPTASVIDQINPDALLTVGDNAYEDGTLSEYQSYYQPNWGRHDYRVYPAPGNHDFHTANAQGYRDYFGVRAPALYYSYDLGAWHVVSLAGGGVSVSTQNAWLQADLAANPSQCLLAYWHEPKFSSGSEHGNSSSYNALWTTLYAAGADVILNGHDHNYQRYAKLDTSGNPDPKGIREFVVGTGGWGHYGFTTTTPMPEVRNGTDYGVMKMVLRSGAYDWQFMPVAGSTFTDSGSDSC